MSDKQTIKTMQCPFVPAHVMPYQRFLNHLEKCQFPDKKNYRKCKFNPYHVIYIQQLANHETNCPDSKKYELEDDDDWGVSYSPPKQQPQKSKDASEVSYSSTISDHKAYTASSSNASYTQYGSSLTSKSKIDHSKGGKVEKEKQAINNTVFQVEDLDDFNPQ